MYKILLLIILNYVYYVALNCEFFLWINTLLVFIKHRMLFIIHNNIFFTINTLNRRQSSTKKLNFLWRVCFIISIALPMNLINITKEKIKLNKVY